MVSGATNIQKMQRVVLRMGQRLVARGFFRWVEHRQQMLCVARAVGRIRCALLGRCVSSWRIAVGGWIAERESAAHQDELASIRVELEAQQMRAVEGLLHRWVWRSVSKCLGSWVSMVGERKLFSKAVHRLRRVGLWTRWYWTLRPAC